MTHAFPTLTPAPPPPQGASKTLGVPMPFLTTILLPIVGNAAEHASAIVFAYKNRVEIALGVAVGGCPGCGFGKLYTSP